MDIVILTLSRIVRSPRVNHPAMHRDRLGKNLLQQLPSITNITEPIDTTLRQRQINGL